MIRRNRHAKILATLGPASCTKEMIRALFEAGADIFRLNFSHGTHADHAEKIQLIREVETEVGRPIGILMDLQGPKLRIGTFASGSATLLPGQSFELHLDAHPGNEKGVSFPHPEIWSALTPGVDLLLDDGRVRLRITAATPNCLTCTVLTTGVLTNNKGVNIPGAHLPLPTLTTQDREDLAFGLAQGVEMVALSFVQSPQDMQELRTLVGERASLIAKIEKPLALASLGEIVALSDGILVARGDLGVEMPPELVPPAQKKIIQAARVAGKPVFVATQMLESMVSSPAPTRAEASDVATAIYDGVDGVTLSAETASGAYPHEAVSMMNRIIQTIEQDDVYRREIMTRRPESQLTTSAAITHAARTVVDTLEAQAIVCYTASGLTALEAARQRPLVPVLALTKTSATARRLTLAWGVYPVVTGDLSGTETDSEMAATVSRYAREADLAAPGERVVVTAGLPLHRSGTTNMLRVVVIS